MGVGLSNDPLVEARRIELPNLLHAMQALYQLSYAPAGYSQPSKGGSSFGETWA